MHPETKQSLWRETEITEIPTSLLILFDCFTSGFNIDSFVENAGGMTLHFFFFLLRILLLQLIYLSSEMRSDI